MTAAIPTDTAAQTATVIAALSRYFSSSLAMRRTCLQCGRTTEQQQSRRLFHGRGQLHPRLEHIVIDWFHPVLFVTVFAELDVELEQALLNFVNGSATNNEEVDALVIQRRYRAPRQTSMVNDCVWGSLPAQVQAIECDWRFALNFDARQNIGFFLDMRAGRHWLREVCSDKKVLNLFAYTCSLSVAALAGGARQVVNVDMSRPALEVGERNRQLNPALQQDARAVSYLSIEVFRSMSRLVRLGPFDVLVIDPPSSQPGSFVASKDYARLLRRLPRLLSSGGYILACLNAPLLSSDYLQQLFSQELPEARLLDRLAQATDFPDNDADGRLKMLVYRL